MTKRDGDRLRAIKLELRELGWAYGPDSNVTADMSEINVAIDFALKGVKFEVRATDPKTGRILPRHATEASRYRN
jgi:hypothetical protein